jgi:hypothetical protein
MAWQARETGNLANAYQYHVQATGLGNCTGPILVLADTSYVFWSRGTFGLGLTGRRPCRVGRHVGHGSKSPGIVLMVVGAQMDMRDLNVLGGLFCKEFQHPPPFGDVKLNELVGPIGVSGHEVAFFLLFFPSCFFGLVLPEVGWSR